MVSTTDGRSRLVRYQQLGDQVLWRMFSNSLAPQRDVVLREPVATHLPGPAEPAYIDRVNYRAVHFYGAQLHIAMRAAADYLQTLEAKWGVPPHVVCTHDEFSAQDAYGDLAWKLTVVINESIEPGRA